MLFHCHNERKKNSLTFTIKTNFLLFFTTYVVCIDMTIKIVLYFKTNKVKTNV